MSGVNVRALGVNSLSPDIKKITNKTENVGQKNNKDFNLILNKNLNNTADSINSNKQSVNYNKDSVKPLNKNITEEELKDKLKEYIKSLKDEKGLSDNNLGGDLLQYLYSVLNISEVDEKLINNNMENFSKDLIDNVLGNNLKSNSKDITVYLKELILKGFNSKENNFLIENTTIPEEFDKNIENISKILEEIYNENPLDSNKYNEKKDSSHLLNRALGNNVMENSKDTGSKSISNNKNINLEEDIVKPNETLNKDINLSSKDSKDENLLKSLSEDKENNKFTDKVNLNLMKFEGLKNNVVGSTDVNMPIVRKEVLQQDVIKWVKFMNIESMKELTLKVVPRELGEIVLKVSLDSGIMKAEILSNNKDTYRLLQNNIVEITNKLQNDSGKVQEVSVNIYSDNYMGEGHENLKENGSENFNNKNKQNRKRSIEAIDAIEEEETISLNEMLNKLA